MQRCLQLTVSSENYSQERYNQVEERRKEASKEMDITIVNAAMSEEKIDGKVEIILRGEIEPSYLFSLKPGEYQREVLPLSLDPDLIDATRKGIVPSITLGMRGGNYDIKNHNTYLLYDPVYIIDGLQRVTAAGELLKRKASLPRLGVTIYFNTKESWERTLFTKLNTTARKLSPNILVANLRHTSESVK